MVMLTPWTTLKNASNMKNTLRPVSGFDEMEGPLIRISCRVLWSHEIVGRRRDLAEPDVGHPEGNRDRFLRITFGRRGDEKPQLGRLVPSNNNHRPVRGHGIGADNVDVRVVRSIDVD